MLTNTRSNQTNADKKAEELANYLAGRGPLAEGYYSMTDLTVALGMLLGDPEVSETDIVSAVRRILSSRKHHFDNIHMVKRALKLRHADEPLYSSLMKVRQARLRRSIRPRR